MSVSVIEAAKKLGMNPQTLRLALQQRLFPFGVAIKTSDHRYTYYINEKGLMRYIEEDDKHTSFDAIVSRNNW